MSISSAIDVFSMQGRDSIADILLDSKPGASAVSTFLSNKCIGLEPSGYGSLLGEVTFSCSRVREHP